MSSSVTKDDLNLDGVVRYTLVRDSSGQLIIDAKWISTRIVGSGRTGTGRAVRSRSGGDSIHKVGDGFEGDWNIEYFGPDGQLAVTPFLLTLSKNDQIYHGQWSLPVNGDPVLEGFGFEDNGQLIMRYGSPR